jgi:lipopolysaccharide export system protein LptA
LYGDKLIYTADNNTAVIPGAGKLFVENHKADANPAAAQQGSSKGAMAIQWNKQMTFDQDKLTITFDGNPRVGFEQEPKADKPAKPLVPMQLDSDQLIVTLSKAVPTTGQTTTTGQGKVQLSHMQANGNIHFVGEGVDLICTTMEYDPKTSIMTLSGSEQEPGKALNAAQSITGTFGRLEFNTDTQELGRVDGMHGTIRR